MSVWTPPVVSRFNELLKAYPVLAYGQIAQRLSAEFGVTITKNAAIGFGRRTGTPKRSPQRLRPSGGPPRARPRRTGRISQSPKKKPRPVPLHVQDKVLLQNLDSGDCRWPNGDDPPYLYCGMPVLENLPYCRKHALISYPALRGKI